MLWSSGGIIAPGYGRKGDVFCIHGSAASRMPRTLADGVAVCVTVSISDALVLARSAFNYAMNYRSVVILGRATLVEDDNPPHPCRDPEHLFRPETGPSA